MKCARGSGSDGAGVDGARGLSEGEGVPVRRGGDMGEASSAGTWAESRTGALSKSRLRLPGF